LGKRAVLARRELRVLSAEKTILLALAIQLFIAAFSSFLVVGLVSVYNPGTEAAVLEPVGVTGNASDDLLETLDERPGLRAREFATEEAAMEAFAEGRVRAVLVSEHRDDRIFVTALAPESELRTTLTVVQVREALRAYERDQRGERLAFLDARPLDLPPQVESSPYYGFTYTVLVPLLLFLPVFISGSIAVDSLTEEIERGTLELIRVAPVSMSEIVDGKLLAAAGLAPAQAAVWLGLLSLNGTRVAQPVLLLATVAALALAITGMGAGVALLSPDRRSAQFLYSLGVLLLFGGATLLPGDPANTVALLAVDSATTGTYLAVGAYVAAAVGVYVGVRRLVDRIDPEELEV
jgi:ABC-type Na+ efflux pump permease subunit